MPDMSEYHETEEEMEDRCDAQRDSEKLDSGDELLAMHRRLDNATEDRRVEAEIRNLDENHPLSQMLKRLEKAGRK